MQQETFKNHFLIAMPSLNDPYFHQTVILLFEHNEKGAMGLIINKPLEITVGEVLQHLSIPLSNTDLDKDKVMLGGPVAPEQGSIVHTYPELCPGDILDEKSQITVSASKEVLQNLIQKMPDNFLICLGYATWQTGQIEQEIAANAWILADINADLIFNIAYKDRWRAAGKLVGVDFDLLSSDIGHG